MISLKPTFFLCLLFLIISSCSKDEMETQNPLLGNYTLTSWSVDTPIDLNNDGFSSTEFDPGCLNNSEIIFSNNSSGSLLYTSFVSYNTFLENGKTVYATTCTINADLDAQQFTYNETATNITIDFNGVIYDVIKNGTTLLLEIPNGFVIKDVDTLEVTHVQDLVYVFEKS